MFTIFFLFFFFSILNPVDKCLGWISGPYTTSSGLSPLLVIIIVFFYFYIYYYFWPFNSFIILPFILPFLQFFTLFYFFSTSTISASLPLHSCSLWIMEINTLGSANLPLRFFSYFFLVSNFFYFFLLLIFLFFLASDFLFFSGPDFFIPSYIPRFTRSIYLPINIKKKKKNVFDFL